MIYIWDKCKVNLGHVKNPNSIHLMYVRHLKKAHLRSNDAPLAQNISSENDGNNTVVSFLIRVLLFNWKHLVHQGYRSWMRFWKYRTW